MTALPELGPDDVHVWRIALERDDATVAVLRRLLSPEEQARADRFTFPHLRAHFTVGRGQMRTILGRYLDRDPAELRFVYGPVGKPALADDALRFNLAHSHGLALLAVARGREVGVDVERIRSSVAGADIAGRYFSPHETAALAQVPAELRERAFFLCWTRKEAYIKAVGKGLSLPLDSFDVSLTPEQPAELLAVRGVAGEVERWSMRELPLPSDYVGALVAEGKSWRLRCGDFQESPTSK